MAFRKNTGKNDLFEGLVCGRPANETLEVIEKIVDWEVVRRILAHGYKEGGRPGYDPVIPAKMLLLEAIYNLSDVAVSRECADRLSFRKFLGLELADTVPDDSMLVRFRSRMRDNGLLEVMEEAFTEMLGKAGLSIRPGSIKVVDATLVQAATRPPRIDKETGAPPRDPDADHTVKRKKPHYGYKLHMAQDKITGLITAHVVTPASVHDSKVFEELLDGEESAVLADKGYDKTKRRLDLYKGKTLALIMKREKKRMTPLGRELVRGFNRAISRVRSSIEPAFANLKRWRRCGRAVYTGIVKVREQMTWGAIAHNFLVAKNWMEKCA